MSSVYKTFDGFHLPNIPFFTEKNFRDAKAYVPRDGDIIITSYPKTGTTWMNYIVNQIITGAEKFLSFDEISWKVCPYIEMAGSEAIEKLEPPRVWKHHLPYNIVQHNEKAKFLYTYRNPEDTCVSFFHFLRQLQPDFKEMELDTFFELFLTGEIGYGSYFDHLKSFLEHRNDPNLLFVSYEKLHQNTREQILRVAKFLGENYYKRLIEDEAMVDLIMERTSFDYMKKNLVLSHPTEVNEKGKINFFRKGKIGDGKMTLREDQLERLRSVAREKLCGFDVLKEWGIE